MCGEGSDSQLDKEKVGVREIESDYKLGWINGYVEYQLWQCKFLVYHVIAVIDHYQCYYCQYYYCQCYYYHQHRDKFRLSVYHYNNRQLWLGYDLLLYAIRNLLYNFKYVYNYIKYYKSDLSNIVCSRVIYYFESNVKSNWTYVHL